MSKSKTPITVEVDDLASWLEILDGGFQVVAEGFGKIKSELPPGLYKARSQVGASVQEKIFAIDEGSSPPAVRLPPVNFPSPVPLQDNTTSHQYYRKAVIVAANNLEPPIVLGAGSSFLLSVRDPSETPFAQRAQTQDAYASSFNGFSLCTTDGDELINYDHAAERNIRLGFAIRKAELNPGRYLLRFQRSGLEPVAIPIITVAGWGSQIFINVDEASAVDVACRPILREAAVIMVPLSQRFHPDDRSIRLTEVARQALQQGRNILDQESIKDLLDNKLANPILGLLVAHLLLLDPKPNKLQLDLLHHLVDNLGQLIGWDFPDVTALGWRLRQIDSEADVAATIQHHVDFPPLLRASWGIISSLAAKDEKIFPAGSVSRKVADRLIDNGIWMAWRALPPQVDAPLSMIMLSDDELQGKKSRDRERILGVLDLAERGFDLEAASNLMRTVKTVAKPVLREKLRQFITTVAHTDHEQLDQLRDLVVRLARNYPWEKLVHKLTVLDADGEISGRLSSLQKSLIPSLMMLRQQLDTDEAHNQAHWEGWLDSLQVPRSVLLENLSDLARLAAGVVARWHDENSAEVKIVLVHPGANKKLVIEEIRAATGLNLKAAREIVNNVPGPIGQSITKTDAEELKMRLEKAGATVRLE